MLVFKVITSFKEIARGMPLSFNTISVHFNVVVNSLDENFKNVEKCRKLEGSDNHKFHISQRCDEGDRQ